VLSRNVSASLSGPVVCHFPPIRHYACWTSASLLLMLASFQSSASRARILPELCFSCLHPSRVCFLCLHPSRVCFSCLHSSRACHPSRACFSCLHSSRALLPEFSYIKRKKMHTGLVSGVHMDHTTPAYLMEFLVSGAHAHAACILSELHKHDLRRLGQIYLHRGRVCLWWVGAVKQGEGDINNDSTLGS